LGVLPGFPAPRQSAIIARLTGANVERSGVFGGMSGSPVYIDGRLVGAIAFTFPFSKEPIAGITPIKQMIDIFTQAERPAIKATSQPNFRPVTAAQLSGVNWKPELPKHNRALKLCRWPTHSARILHGPAAHSDRDSRRLRRHLLRGARTIRP
ncbi:MAG: hypothetical protein WKF30_10900, partial [Pyrinomonadaceae bacterium]